MDLIRLALRRPMAVFAAVLIVVVLGLAALQAIPIQLTPDVRQPILEVTTSWPGAAPTEVEREITNRLEEELTGLEGLVVMTSSSDLGRSRITLEFAGGVNMDRAFMLVSNRLNAISDLPDEAGEPRVESSSTDDVPIARLAITRTPGNERGIETYGDFVEDVVAERLQRVPGVSQVDQSGGSARELQVVIEPADMARYGLTVPRMIQALRNANVSMTAGAVDEGKRRYVVRADAETATVESVAAVILQTSFDRASGRLSDITVGDVADIRFGYAEATSYRRFNGEPMIRIDVIRDTGANVIATMRGIVAATVELNQRMLPREGLTLELFYDETLYINSAITLVEQNIFVGGILAALILLLFLRSWRATLVVGLAIPISVISAFVAMAALGRSINVISLAGIAFAVGMVVDAAIVVLENIYRHLQSGRSAADAAHLGARQVWGAVLASALTTVVVFIPVLTLDLPAGQLFRDIAVAISVAVLLSLVVAVTVIPVLARFLLAGRTLEAAGRFRLPLIDPAAAAFARSVLGLVRRVIDRRWASVAVVVVVCGSAACATWLFLPPLDYLPDGNRNFVFGRLQPPPGYNLRATSAVAAQMEDAVRPLWASVSGPESVPGEPPKIESFFFIALRSFTLIGASSVDIDRAGELIPVLARAAAVEPGTRSFISQSSIFGRQIGGARVINMDFAHPELGEILEVARRADALIAKAMPRHEGTQVRALPGLDLSSPEIRVSPDQRKLANAGLSARDLAQTIDVLNDGMKIVEVNVGAKRIDLRLKGPDGIVEETQGIGDLPIVTGLGTILPAHALSTIELTAGPSEIRHLDRDRSVTLQISPAKGIPLETAIERLRSEVIVPLEAEGVPSGMKIRLSGAADDLTKTWNALKINLLIAIVVVYLLLAVLFESLLFPAIIMFSVPLATAGGLGGLAVVNTWVEQPLDMLTMLGFVILIGTVVNNAILLVDQTLQHVRQDAMERTDAILAATRNRMRPIFMSTLTSVFGLVPLVVFPGAGSELYRGLGSVVVGGLTLSAVLTLTIIPPLLALLLPQRVASGAASDDGVVVVALPENRREPEAAD